MVDGVWRRCVVRKIDARDVLAYIEIEPPIAVIVDPTQPASHHGGRVTTGLPSEGTVAEVKADFGRNVGERDLLN